MQAEHGVEPPQSLFFGRDLGGERSGGALCVDRLSVAIRDALPERIVLCLNGAGFVEKRGGTRPPAPSGVTIRARLRRRLSDVPLDALASEFAVWLNDSGTDYVCTVGLQGDTLTYSGTGSPTAT